MGRKATATAAVILLLAGVLSFGLMPMPPCPECVAGSPLMGLGFCLAVLAAGLVLVHGHVEWLRVLSFVRFPLPRPPSLDRPPRSA